jgi:phospholipid-binding lipoprotein MlaA
MTNRLYESTVAGAFLLLLLGLMASGCASAPVQKQAEIPAKRPISEIVKPDVEYVIDAYDPLEGMNRRIYKFNALFDEYVFLPVVSGYEFITPGFVQSGVSNFFGNLHELKPLMNSLLQLKVTKFGMTLSRIVVNTTVGIGGLLDVADPIGIPKQNEDFGQTLGFYGLGPGPYLVLPIFGPSTIRDTCGLVVDAVAYNAMIDEIIDELDMDSSDEDRLKSGLTLLDSIDTRHQQSFRYYATGSPFEYDLIRRLYFEAREFQVAH